MIYNFITNDDNQFPRWSFERFVDKYKQDEFRKRKNQVMQMILLKTLNPYPPPLPRTQE